MTETGKKLALMVFGGVILIGVAVFAFTHTPEPTSEQLDNGISTLRSFVDAANEVSGIQSGAAFNYSFVTSGNPANFSIQRCQDEVRCDVVISTPVAKFQQPNQLSADLAEVDTKANTVISLHRAVLEFAGGEYSAAEVERIARAFLDRVYPEFKTLEPTLTFDPGMKGTRLNNGNYFFRWYDPKFKEKLSDGDRVELDPFIQVGVTAGGFIFSYDNTVVLSQLIPL